MTPPSRIKRDGVPLANLVHGVCANRSELSRRREALDGWRSVMVRCSCESAAVVQQKHSLA